MELLARYNSEGESGTVVGIPTNDGEIFRILNSNFVVVAEVTEIELTDLDSSIVDAVAKGDPDIKRRLVTDPDPDNNGRSFFLSGIIGRAITSPQPGVSRSHKRYSVTSFVEASRSSNP